MKLCSLIYLLSNAVAVFSASPSTAQLDFKFLQDSCKELKEKTMRLKYMFQDIRDDNEKISYTIRNLKQFSNDVKSYFRVDNLEILGVPKTVNEDLMGILRNISVAIDVPFKEFHISSVWRKHDVSTGQKKLDVDSIIVRFVSRSTRNEWLKKGRRKIVIHSKECLPELPPSDIYINEHLTQSKKSLMKVVKQLEADNKIPYAWLKDGNIYIRRTSTGKAVKIRSTHDLKMLGLLE